MTTHPNVRQVLVLSTMHLDPDFKPDRYLMNPSRSLMSVTDDYFHSATGNGVVKALQLAKFLDCDYILFKVNEPPLKSLPIYE